MTQVIILDKTGKEMGFKEKSAVDRLKDSLYAVHGLIFTADNKLALATLPSHDQYPGIFKGKVGSSCATLLRQGEATDDAIMRCLKTEVPISPQPVPVFLGEEFDVIEGGIYRKQAVYQVKTTNTTFEFNPEKITKLQYVTQTELEQMIASNKAQFTPTFLVIYQRYRKLMWR